VDVRRILLKSSAAAIISHKMQVTSTVNTETVVFLQNDRSVCQKYSNLIN